MDWYGKEVVLRLGSWSWQLSSDLNDTQEIAILISGHGVSCRGMADL